MLWWYYISKFLTLSYISFSYSKLMCKLSWCPKTGWPPAMSSQVRIKPDSLSHHQHDSKLHWATPWANTITSCLNYLSTSLNESMAHNNPAAKHPHWSLVKTTTVLTCSKPFILSCYFSSTFMINTDTESSILFRWASRNYLLHRLKAWHITTLLPNILIDLWSTRLQVVKPTLLHVANF